MFLIERRPIGASFYLAVSCLNTVDYGDDHFYTFRGRLFAVVWLFLGITIAFKSISLLFFRIQRLEVQLLPCDVECILSVVLSMLDKLGWAAPRRPHNSCSPSTLQQAWKRNRYRTGPTT